MPCVQVRVACDLNTSCRGSFFSLSSEKIKARDRLVIGGSVFSAERDGELMVLCKLRGQAQLDSLRSAFAQAARLTVLRGNAGALEVLLGSTQPAICSKAQSIHLPADREGC